MTPEELTRLAAQRRALMEAEEAERELIVRERAAVEAERAALVRQSNELAERLAREAQPAEPIEAEEEEESSDEAECPDCAEWIKSKAKVCRFCGCKIVRDSRGSPRKSGGGRSRRRGGRRAHYAQQHNPALCAVLSLLMPGAGQMVAGDVGRGVALLGAYVALWVAGVVVLGCAGLVGALVVAVFAVVDAYSMAEQANRRAGWR